MKGELIDEILNILKFILKKWKFLIAKETLAQLIENDGIKDFLNDGENKIYIKTEEDTYFIPEQDINTKELEIDNKISRYEKTSLDQKPIKSKRGRKPREEKNKKLKVTAKDDIKDEAYKNLQEADTPGKTLLNHEFKEKICRLVYKILLENGFDEDKAQELSSVIEQNIRSKDPTFGEKYQKLARIMIKEIKTLDKHSFEEVCASLV